MTRTLHFITIYFWWHYTRAIANFMTVWGNFLWFFYHFFSIPTLVRTFFTPWHRLSEQYSGGFHLQQLATALVVNGMMRLIGMTFRFVLIVLGLVMLALVAVGGALFFVAWLLMPLLIIGLLIIASMQLI